MMMMMMMMMMMKKKKIKDDNGCSLLFCSFFVLEVQTPIYDILIPWRFFAKRYESGRSGDCMIIERREVAVARLTVNNSKLMVMSLSIHTLQHFSLLAENRGISKYGLVSYYFI